MWQCDYGTYRPNDEFTAAKLRHKKQQEKLLKQHCAPFSSLSGATSYCAGHLFLTYLLPTTPFYTMLRAISLQKIHRRNAKFHLTRHWLSLQTNDSKCLKRLDSSYDSTLTWLDQVVSSLWLDLINFRYLWLKGLVTLARKKWLGHVPCCFLDLNLPGLKGSVGLLVSSWDRIWFGFKIFKTGLDPVSKILNPNQIRSQLSSEISDFPVSSEISDLRNFWLHAMCACSG